MGENQNKMAPIEVILSPDVWVFRFRYTGRNLLTIPLTSEKKCQMPSFSPTAGGGGGCLSENDFFSFFWASATFDKPFYRSKTLFPYFIHIVCLTQDRRIRWFTVFMKKRNVLQLLVHNKKLQLQFDAIR